MAHELIDVGIRHGSVIAEQLQPVGDQGSARLDAPAQIHRGAGQIGQRPVEVGAAGLLHHLLQAAEGEVRDPQPDEIRDLSAVFAQVPGQREQRLGGADRVVEPAPGHLATEPDLERRRQDLELPQLPGNVFHISAPAGLMVLPVDGIQAGRPVGMAERRAAVPLELA